MEGTDMTSRNLSSICDNKTKAESPTQSISSSDSAVESGRTASDASTLPPSDTGKDAFLFLAAAFTIEAFVWGFPLSYGVFQSYYSTHPPFQGDHRIATVGTTATGLMYLSIPAWLAFIASFPSLHRPAQVIALFVMTAGLIASSFASTIPQLVATQGIMYGLGGPVLYVFLMLYLDDWFVKCKGLAYGITWAGTGFAGVVVPPIMQLVLDRWGYRIALRAWAISNFLLLAPTLLAIKPRQRPAEPRPLDYKFLRDPAFTIMQLGNIVQALGFFIPALYIPSYAHSLGASDSFASAILIIYNVASVAGCVGIGWLVDHFHVTTCTTLCAVGSGISVFLFWGLWTKLPVFVVFAALYGLFAGGVSCTWSGTMRIVTKRTGQAEPTLIMSFLATGRGIGNIVSGPVSEKLLTFGWHNDNAKLGYETQYGPLMVFTGVTAVCAGLTIFGRAKKGLM